MEDVGRETLSSLLQPVANSSNPTSPIVVSGRVRDRGPVFKWREVICDKEAGLNMKALVRVDREISTATTNFTDAGMVHRLRGK